MYDQKVRLVIRCRLIVMMTENCNLVKCKEGRSLWISEFLSRDRLIMWKKVTQSHFLGLIFDWALTFSWQLLEFPNGLYTNIWRPNIQASCEINQKSLSLCLGFVLGCFSDMTNIFLVSLTTFDGAFLALTPQLVLSYILTLPYP